VNKAYSRINFQNAPSTATPLNATNLNKMDKAINDLDDRIIELSGYQEEAQEAAEQASSSASAAAKAAETATADAEARVNAIIEGLEVYTKEESDKKFASVIKQVATGSPILIKDGAGVEALDFKGKGRSTQRQWSGFDGELLSGAYGASDGKYATNSNYVCSKNPMPCKEGESIKLTYGTSAAVMSLFFYDENMAYLNYKDANNTNGCAFNAPTNASYFHFRINENNATMTPQTAKNITVSVNGSTSYPNPDYSQEIKSVADSGYFDGELLQGYYDTTNGNFTTSSVYVCSKNIIPCKPSDAVVLKYEETAVLLLLSYYDENGNYLSRKSVTNVNSLSDTVPANAYYFHISINSGDITPTNAKHITVTINGKYALIVKSKGKNLWNINGLNLASSGATSSVNGDTITIIGSYYIYQPIKVKPNTNYYVSGSLDSYTSYGRLVIYSSDFKTQLNAIVGNAIGKIGFAFNSSSYTDIVLVLYGGNATSGTSVYSNIQLEENTVATPYEPYKESVTYIPLNEPIRSSLDGTVTDELSLSEVTRRYAEIVLDGSEDEGWTLNGYAANGYTTNGEETAISLFQRTDNKLPIVTASDTVKRVISDKLIASSRSKEKLVNSCCVANNQRLFICLEGTIPLANFKAQLQANPITVIYELAEPITEEIEPVDIVTYDNVTYISNADNAEMEVTYATDTKQYIDNKFAELHAALVNML
jgi:hypothetical protein